MFAVVRTGGKQYKVADKDRFEVARLDAKEGDTVELEVMATSDGKGITMGDKGAKVSATVVSHKRGDKITVFKKKRRQNYRRKKGHRQDLTVIEIAGIKAA